MIKARPKVLAIIPARKGSKRLPGKNHKKFNGKSLIKWTIESAINSKYISHIVLSSNDEVVLQIGSSYEEISCLNRSNELSGDHISSAAVVLDVLESYEGFDYFISVFGESNTCRQYRWCIPESLYSETIMINKNIQNLKIRINDI